MYPTHHAAAAIAAAAPLARRGWTRPALAAFALAAVLIDVDHYLSYACARGDLSLWRAYRYHRAREQRSRWGLRRPTPALLVDPRRPFHAVAVLAALLLAARRWPGLRPLALGALFHRLLDLGWECVRVPVRPRHLLHPFHVVHPHERPK
jgi:hypothetical protein